jgi:uncharacterized metal-binding protein
MSKKQIKKLNTKEKIVFAITEETIELEAEKELGRDLTEEELEAVIGEIESEATPIFEFIRDCILNVVEEEPEHLHEGNII